MDQQKLDHLSALELGEGLKRVDFQRIDLFVLGSGVVINLIVRFIYPIGRVWFPIEGGMTISHI